MYRFCQMLIVVFLSALSIYGQGLRIESPYIQGFHPLDDELEEYSMLKSRHPVLLNLTTKLFIDTSVVYFEKRQITFRRTDPLGYTLWEYHYGELSDYLSERRNFALGRGWKRVSTDALKVDAKSKQNVVKLQWELPVQYPSWAQRIMGNDPPRLTINGSLRLTIGIDSHLSKNSDEDPNPITSNDFKLNEEYNFSVTGSVGRLISVNIRSSSENSFDLSNNLQNFKIEYKESTPGELEDEIIQEVSAGYTNFDMPGSKLTGIMESKKGLFGIKIKSKIGPLMLTSIAATENGVSESKTFSSSSGGDEQIKPISQYEENKFYYLDNIYRDAYIRKHAKKNGDPNVKAPEIGSFDVWLKDDGISRQDLVKTQGRELVYIIDNEAKYPYNDSIFKKQTYTYYKLTPKVHYNIDLNEGYIQFTDSIYIGTNDQIAIYLHSKDNTIQKGDYSDPSRKVLWSLKGNEINSLMEDPLRYNLMWRNVYSMSKTEDLTNFKLSIINKDPDIATDKDGTEKKSGSDLYYSNIVGLADEKGKPLTAYSDIFDTKNGFIIIPPYDTTMYGDCPFTNPDLDKPDTTIYKYSSSSRPSAYKSEYFINGSGSKKKTMFENIAYDIISGTDKVWADGRELIRDKDYIINYEMGTLELISIKAKTANTIKADYQTGSMFNPDKKVFLGVNGQLQLPFISEKSFIGGTILYQDVKVSENIPRIGQEPYSKVVFDINTNIDLEPVWMTTLVNKLPFVETSVPSSAVLDLEVAHSRMNPNPDDKAYIDDFENSKVSYTIPSDVWFQASPPDTMLKSNQFYKTPPAWNYYWFSPKEWDSDNKVPRKEIYNTAKDASSLSQDQSVSVLRFDCKPAPSNSIYRDKYRNAWAGIMTPIPLSYAKKDKEKYFELLVKVVDAKGKPGKLKIQMGEMREDLSLDGAEPNGRADQEDTSAIHIEDNYRPELDKGLDRLNDTSEYYCVPNVDGTGWDTLRIGDEYLEEFKNDPSKDNWAPYNDKNKINYKFNCKKQSNQSLESEDINFNGTVEYAINERYFEYTIDLQDTTAPYYVRDTSLNPDGHWRRIKIPLKEDLPEYKKAIGNPDWNKIRMVRLIWSDFDEDHITDEYKLAIAEMEFVGNQWESKIDSVGSQFEALTIGNKDGTDYEVPSSIKLTTDRSSKEVDIEQSLRIVFRNLRNKDEAVVSKSLVNQGLDMTAYKNLHLLVYGKKKPGELDNQPLYQGRVKFVFRFGTDSSTYYEYRKEIMPGWNNNISIDLQKIAQEKDRYMVQNPDTTIADTNGTFIVNAPKGRQPNLANIQWMGLGVVRNDNSVSDIDSGEIWVNEMIVDGIDNINGWSASANLSTKWADVFNLSAGMGYTNGNYRQMQDLKRTANDSKMNTNLDASIALDKFLPKDWGVNLPLGGLVSGTVTRPQLKNNDVSLSQNGKADGLTDMAGDALRMIMRKPDNGITRESELYAKQDVLTRIYTSYDKSSPSRNLLSGLIADKISGSFDYSNKVSLERQGKKPNNDSVYVKTDTVDTYNGTLRYDLSPKEISPWTKWKLVKNDSDAQWLPKRLRSYEFALLPSQIKFDLANINYVLGRGVDTKKNTSTHYRTFSLKHGFSMDYTPIAPLLQLDYRLTINRNLDTVAGQGRLKMLNDVFKRNENKTWRQMSLLYREESRIQHAGIRLDPQLLDWLTNSFEYSSDFTGTHAKISKDTNDYLNANVKTNFSFNSSIDIEDLISGFKSKTKPDSTMIAFENGFKKLGLRTISYNYAASSNLQNNYLSTSLLQRSKYGFWDFFLYQIGQKDRTFNEIITGDMNDYHEFGGMWYRKGGDDYSLYKNDSRMVERSHKFSTGLDLTYPFEIHFNPISFGFSTKFTAKPDSTFIDTTYSFPEISVNTNTPAFMKVGVISDFFTSFSANSAFSYKKMMHIRAASRDTTIRIDLAPLIAISALVKKWPINLNYSHSYSKEDSKQKLISSYTVTNGDELKISYEIEKNSRLSEIRVLNWTIPVKGKTTVGFTGYRKGTYTKYNDGHDDTNITLSINPFLTYIFTDNVTGTLQYSWAQDKKNTATDKNSSFELIVDIRF